MTKDVNEPDGIYWCPLHGTVGVSCCVAARRYERPKIEAGLDNGGPLDEGLQLQQARIDNFFRKLPSSMTYATKEDVLVDVARFLLKVVAKTSGADFKKRLDNFFENLTELEERVEHLEAHTSPQPSCKCAEIMANDQRRHFRGCPLREKYPTHEAEKSVESREQTPFEQQLQEHRAKMERDIELGHGNLEVKRVRDAVWFLLAVAHQPKGQRVSPQEVQGRFADLEVRVEKLEKETENIPIRRGPLGTPEVQKVLDEMLRTTPTSSNGGPVDPHIIDEVLKPGTPLEEQVRTRIVDLSDSALQKLACEMLDGVLYDAQGTTRNQVGEDEPTQEAKLLATRFRTIRDDAKANERTLVDMARRISSDETGATSGRGAFRALDAPYFIGPGIDLDLLRKRAEEFADDMWLPTSKEMSHEEFVEWLVPYLGRFHLAESNRPLTPWEMPPPYRPKVVVLCGSTSFAEEFRKVNLAETLKGHIVLTVGSMMHHDNDAGIFEGSDTKKMLDALHKKKIELADEVLVLNVKACTVCKQPYFDGIEKTWCVRQGEPAARHEKFEPYMGSSTKSEIQHALALGKPVRFLNDQLIDTELWRQIKPAGSESGPIGQLFAGEPWSMFKHPGER